MKLVYSRRALADLDQIKTYYAAYASPAIAEAIGRRLENVVDRIRRVPEARSARLAALRGSRRCRHSLSIPDLLPGARR
jgi:plasmid stabilization system protein ParE